MKFKLFAIGILSLAGLSMTVGCDSLTGNNDDDRYGNDRISSRDRDRYDSSRRDRYDTSDRKRSDTYSRDRYDTYDRSRSSGSTNYGSDFDRNISSSDVPSQVLDTVRRERPSNKVESVQHVRHNGREFYRFRFDGTGGQDDLILRVLRDGSVLSSEQVQDTGRGGPKWDNNR